MKRPKKVAKPWGWELWFAHSENYVGKVIFVRKGHRLSRQYHRFKHETVYAHKGTWILEIAGKKKHRFTAPLEDAWLIEVSTPQVKDVVRLEDDYGRAPR